MANNSAYSMIDPPVMQSDLQDQDFGAAVVIVELGQELQAPTHGPATIVVGVARGELPALPDVSEFDLLLTTAEPASRAWIHVNAEHMETQLSQLCGSVSSIGPPAAVLAQVLRVGRELTAPDALLLESFAFSTLLGGRSFRHWLAQRPSYAGALPGPRIRVTRDADVLTIALSNPSRRNAVDALMRDELVEALAAACDDPTRPAVHMHGDGPDFSAGGDLAEFGSASDLTQAHAIRSLRSPVRLIQAMAARTTAFLHGACVGAGIEIPAAAGRVVASASARFWLPELAMGLIPGAGGTVTITRRIGRQRLLYWALSGMRLDAVTAHRWGLIDEVQGHT